MKIYLLGYFGSGAYADDLIGEITRRMLQDAWTAAERPGQLTIHDRTTHACPAAGPDVAKFLNEYDLVVFCGGSLLGRLRLPPFHRVETWIERLAVPLVLLGTGWRREDLPLSREEIDRMQLLLGHAQAVYVRGEMTRQQILDHRLPAERVRVLGDPGLCFEPPTPRGPAPEKMRVGVVVRQMSDVEINQDRATLDNETWHIRLAEILEALIAAGHEIVFCPMTPEWRKHDNDHLGTDAVRRNMRSREPIEVLESSIWTLPPHLATFDLVVSQRLHGTLISLSQGVPVFPIEYQFAKMADSLSLPGFERIHQLITPQRRVDVPRFFAKLPMLLDPSLQSDTQAACDVVRAEYRGVIAGLLR